MREISRALRALRGSLKGEARICLTALVGLLFCAATAGAPAIAPVSAGTPPLMMGVAWYPEQWSQARWGQDLDLMQQAHVNVVRVAEFAWSTLEPQEGKFDFEWLDRAIAEAAQHHISVVLGTPTAAPPAWLTSKYPDVLRVDEDGRPDEHGERQHFSFSSPRYRTFARRIAEQMALRYGRNPNVIGWQIDNEISPPSFDAETKAQFHHWLRNKYITIAELNRRWTTAYWSQTYDDFDQIPMHSKNENPGLLLDWKHFVSDTWSSYIANQVEAIRPHADQRQFITTNTMRWNAGFNHYSLHRPLDMAAWDDYVPSGHYVWLDNAAQHDLVRGYKAKNFWVMETQPAVVNWWPINRSLDPGQVREMAWQAVGHGADAVLYWQWRSALNGQEQYHGTLVGADGTPVPVYAEVQKIGAEFERAADAIAGTSRQSQVAMLQSYDSRWAIDFQRHHKDFDPVEEFDVFYRPLQLGAQAVDIISPDSPLQGYRLVVAPALNVMSREQAEHLSEYVRNGGHLVLGPRSGMKDAFNSLWPQRQPGPLSGVLGARVEQFYAIDQEIPVSGTIGTGRATIWAEALEPQGSPAEVVMKYGAGNGWLAGKPAIVTRSVGKGSITYVGAWLDPQLMRRLANSWLAGAGVKAILPGLSPDVEFCERSGAGRKVWILINHGDSMQTIHLPPGMSVVVSATKAADVAELAPHDVIVLQSRVQ